MATAAPMMLDSAEASRWVSDDIDALPYADVLPENWRAGVDQLINEAGRGGLHSLPGVGLLAWITEAPMDRQNFS
jgi:hypothetical protein